MTWCFLMIMGNILSQPRPLGPPSRQQIANKSLSEIRELFEQSQEAFQNGQDSLAMTCLIDAVVEGRNYPFSDQMFEIELHYSTTLFDLGAPKLALQNLRFLERLSRHSNNPKHARKIKAQYAMIYLGMEDYQEAQKMFLDIFLSDTKSSGDEGVASSINNLGFVYYLAGDLDSAKLFLDMAFENLTAFRPEDTLFLSVIMDNYALVALEKGRHTYARDIFLRNSLQQKQAGRHNKYFPSLIKLASAYSRMDMSDSAEYYFSRFNEEVSIRQDIDPNHLRSFWTDYYTQAIEHYRRHGDSLTANHTQLEFLTFKDSLRSANAKSLDILLSQIQRLMERSRRQLNQIVDLRHQKTVDHLEQERHKSRTASIITIIVIMGFLFMAIFIWIVVRSRIRNSRQQAKVLEAENKLTQLQLRNESLEKIELKQKLLIHRKESTDLALEIRRKREWMKEIQAELHGLRNKEDIDKALRKLIPNRHIDDKQELFLERVDELNESFYDELLSRFPKLTSSEKELCGLIRLRLSSKEIAASRQITVNAVKVARRRLRKKLTLSPEENLYEFIATI